MNEIDKILSYNIQCQQSMQLEQLEEFRQNPEEYVVTDSYRRIELSPSLSAITPFHREDCISYLYDRKLAGREYFSIPLTEQRRDAIERVVDHLKRCDTTLFNNFQLRYCRIDSPQNDDPISTLALFQIVESGTPLTEYVGSAEADVESLYSAIDLLENTMQHYAICFDEISPDMVIVGLDGRLYPCQYDRLTPLTESTFADLTLLRGWLRESSGCEPSGESDCMEPYPSRFDATDRYPHQGAMQCGRVVVESRNGLWGYLDMSGDEVIKPKYSRAFDFVDGYAVVAIDSRWGLIDSDGNEVIPPIYDDLSYTGGGEICALCRDRRWAYFACDGGQLTPFVMGYPDLSISKYSEVKGLEFAYPSPIIVS